MKLKYVLYLVIIVSMAAGCDRRDIEGEESHYSGEGENIYPDTKILDNANVYLQHVDSITLEEKDNQYIGIIWNAVIYDGQLYIPDMTSRSIKVFSSEGKYLRHIGSEGAGPGEFMGVRGGFAIENDTLIILDNILERVNIFLVNGEYIRSFYMPSSLHNTGLLGEMIIIHNDIIIPIYENKYAPMEEYHLSRTIAVLDESGDIKRLLGRHPDEYSVYTMSAPSASITHDYNGHLYQLSRESPIIQKYKLSGEFVKRFGVIGNQYKPVSFDHRPDMSIQEINRLARERSFVSTMHWIPPGYLIHGYHNITDDSERDRDPMKHDRYLQVYTDTGKYIPSDIPMPGVLLTCDDNGLLYILVDNTPGNITIEVYKLKIEINNGG